MSDSIITKIDEMGKILMLFFFIIWKRKKD